MSEPARTRPPTIDEMRAEIANERFHEKADKWQGHHCHWPGCTVQVDPRMWGCRRHWFMLPKPLRDRIWAAYVPGQEIRKDPSDEYIRAAKDVREWCLEYMARNGGFRTERERP